MDKELTTLKKALSQIVNEPITQAGAKIGSMFILDFGSLVNVDLPTKQGIKSYKQGKGSFWAWQAPWYFRKSGKVLCDSEQNSTEQIRAFVQSLVGIKLISFDVDRRLGLTLTFEDSVILSLSPKADPDSTLWTLSVRGIGEFIADLETLTFKPRS